MQQKLQTRAFRIVTPFLQPGERPLSATRAMLGSFSASRLGTVVTQGVILGGGGVLAAQVLSGSRKQFVVVTDRRIIFLPQTFLGGPGRNVIAEVSRADVTLAEATIGMMSVLRLAFAQGSGLSLTFPRMDRRNAEELKAALPAAPAA